jgi:hypothetical protein
MRAAMPQARADMSDRQRIHSRRGNRELGIGRLIMSRGLSGGERADAGRRRDVRIFLIRKDLADGVRITAGGFKVCLELLLRGRPGDQV